MRQRYVRKVIAQVSNPEWNYPQVVGFWQKSEKSTLVTAINFVAKCTNNSQVTEFKVEYYR